MHCQRLERAARTAAALLLLLSFTLYSPRSAVGDEERQLNLDKAEKQVMKISEKGCEPDVVRLKQLDGTVFFVNTSADSLLTLDVNFGKKRVHCASSNLQLGDDGRLRSKAPIAPRDFATTCFPERGEYDVTILGLKGKASPLAAKVIVE